MLLGFKRQFEPFVVQGTKRHTIRACRKKGGPRAGMVADCYGDSRQKSMHLLGRWPITRVERIRLSMTGETSHLRVFIEDVELTTEEAEAFLWRDGFRDGENATRMAARFWRERLSKGPWEGELIHWDFDKPVTGKKTRR